MSLNLFLPRIRYFTHEPLSAVRKPRTIRKAFYLRSSGQRTFNPHASSERKSANYKPTSWNYNILQSLSVNSVDEAYEDKLKQLEGQVRGSIDPESTADWLTILEKIDQIGRLGLGYRFGEEIRRSLDKFVSLNICEAMKVKSLHAAALTFRLLRQYGYSVTPDIFSFLLDREGNCLMKTCLPEDVKGLLSLYEASHIAFEEETIMDKAKETARTQLIGLKEKQLDETLMQQVSHALELPLHYRIPRLEARWFIESYQEREEKNNALLELAKLNFNRDQSDIQRDIKDSSRWWKDTALSEKLSFSRDRLMECFFCATAVGSQIESRACWKGLTKALSFTLIVDDIYDTYGSLDELELFTEAVERWDVTAVNYLPYYMKLCFLSLYNTVNEMAYDTLRERGENVIPPLAKAWADLCKAFLQEAKWNHDECTPTFEDYIENAWITSTGPILLVHAYFLANQNLAKGALDSLENYHDLLRYSSIIVRLCNDLSTSLAELERGEYTNAIWCYMHETGVSHEVARRNLRKLIDEAWKKLNKVPYENSPFDNSFVEIAKDMARTSHCTYQYGDGLGAPDVRLKKWITALIIEPIPLVG